jgi:hypothetical protein
MGPRGFNVRGTPVSHNAGTECPTATASEKKSNIGVPEPANRALLLIAAFELIGTSMRRRKTIPPSPHKTL